MEKTDWRIVAAEQATCCAVIIDGKPGAEPAFLWRWDPSADPGIKPGHAAAFCCIDECKVKAAGRKLLVNASAAGVACIDIETCRADWYSVLTDPRNGAGPHSVDLLPDGCVVVANSTDVNEIQLIDVRENPLDPEKQERKCLLPLYGAHGVSYSYPRHLLYVLGFEELIELDYIPKTRSVEVRRKWSLEKEVGETYGHDLAPDGRTGFYFTAHGGVWHFDPDTEVFSPVLLRSDVKSFSRDCVKGDLLQIPTEQWWSDHLIAVGTDGGDRIVGPFPGARFYKARWLSENAVTEVKVDFSSPAGPVRPLHGVNNAPVRPMPGSEQPEFKKAGIPFMRTHDTHSMWGGTHYVDIPNLFPDFDADENDPASYDFTFTDGYLKPVVEAGIEVFYRLGVTIENYYEVKAYNIYPPKDFAKWARICEHVVRHYNEGWADGFHWNIKYWEIWNEPENPPMWQGTREEFFEMYRVAANHLKEKFPDIRIGGYASCGFYGVDAMNEREWSPFYSGFVTWFEDFCRYVRSPETSAPLDFFSWHIYTSEPERIMRHAEYARRTLDENGLAGVESILNEWNIVASIHGRHQWDNMKEAPGASFVAASMALMQAGSVDKAMYYDALPTRAYCGLFYYPSLRTTPCYEVFRAFNELYKLGKSVKSLSDDHHVYAVAAADGEKAAVLMTNYSWEVFEKTRCVKVGFSGGPDTFRKYVVGEGNSTLTYAGEVRSGDILEIAPYDTILLLSGVDFD